jgi:1-acyl-sn-glycerol-3-phosphate acyltransferase
MSDAPAPVTGLTRIERLALWFGKAGNEDPRGKWIQNRVLRGVSYVWVRPILARRILADGLEDLITMQPERGVLMVSNHRSFFDLYSLLLACYMGPVPWAKRLYFPVRSNFFYDHPLGIAVNVLAAGGSMYPPIYRQTDRRSLNDDALDVMVKFLQMQGSIVGMHPEGTRNKNDDPYTFLPAQPGVGKLALLGKPTVLPLFINGLGNSFLADVKANFTREARTKHAVIAVFGKPVDYTDLLTEKPRPTLYKKAADRFMAAIAAQTGREKELRADVNAGRITADDPRWIANRGVVGKLYAREG